MHASRLLAVIGSRQRPPVTLVPVNNNDLGARNEMIPTDYTPKEKLVKRQGKTVVVERNTEFPNPNIAKETPLHPPYESSPTASSIIQGSQYYNVSFPIVF